jgi:ATP phosphoribosyltransferase
VLREGSVEIEDERNSRKRPMEETEANALLARLETVLVARGKKLVTLPAAQAKPDDLKGPTGNFRAPMVHSGKTLLVGFNLEALSSLL